MSVQAILTVLMLLEIYTKRSTCCYFNPQLAIRSTKTDLDTLLLANRLQCTLVLSPSFDYPRIDDWGNAYLFLCVDERVSVISAGPDGLFGTFDDHGTGTVFCAWPNVQVTDRSRSSCHPQYSPW